MPQETVLDTLYGLFFSPDIQNHILLLRSATYMLPEYIPVRSKHPTPEAVKAVTTYGTAAAATRLATLFNVPSPALLIQLSTILDVFQAVPGMQLALFRKGVYSSFVDCFWKATRDNSPHFPGQTYINKAAHEAQVCVSLFGM